MKLLENDQRLDPRVRARVPAAVFGGAGALQGVPLVTFNLSLGGALCDSDTEIPLGGPVTLRLDLQDETGALHPAVLEAIVLRVEGRGPFRVAFHFVSVPARAADLLKSFVRRLLAGP